MKNSIYSLILMIGLLVCMTGGNEVMASGHPELVSDRHPELVSDRHPELVSGPSQTALLANSATAASTKASVAGDVQIAFEQTNEDTEVPGNFFLKNWGSLLLGFMGFLDVVARLTPSTRDNSIVNLLVNVLNAIIPNFKKGGGSFKTESR